MAAVLPSSGNTARSKQNSRSWWSSLPFPKLWPDNQPENPEKRLLLNVMDPLCGQICSSMFQPPLFNICNKPSRQFPRIWGLEKIESSTGMCVWVTQRVKPSPRHLQMFHMLWSRQVELWNRSRWVSYGLWLSLENMSLPLLHGDWPAPVGSADLHRSGLRCSLSGQMNFNDGAGLLLASVLIADTLTGQKYRHLGSYGRLWVDSHLTLAYASWLLPSPLDSVVSGASWERWCSWPDTATSLKAPHLSSLTSHWHSHDFSHCQHGLNDIVTARTAAATVQQLSWSSLQKTEKNINNLGMYSCLCLAATYIKPTCFWSTKAKFLVCPGAPGFPRERVADVFCISALYFVFSISAFTSDSLPRWPILREGMDRLGGIGDTVACC